MLSKEWVTFRLSLCCPDRATVTYFHRISHITLQSNRSRPTFICSGSGRDGHNGGVWKECECSQESCPLGQHKYSSESFEGEMALYRGGRKDYKPVLAKRYVVCVVLNGESGFQDDAVMRKLKFGELPLAR